MGWDLVGVEDEPDFMKFEFFGGSNQLSAKDSVIDGVIT